MGAVFCILFILLLLLLFLSACLKIIKTLVDDHGSIYQDHLRTTSFRFFILAADKVDANDNR